MRGPSGRKRFNVLGAIDAVTLELTTVVNDTVIDAMAVCELLQKLAGRYVGLPLTLVLDNARYQKCEVVRLLAAELGIELLYLPSYSPNLNLIERLWKFVKKEVLACRYYEDFARFKAAITECLEGVEGKHRGAIKSLLTLRFQTFEKPQLLAG
jgi:transposase